MTLDRAIDIYTSNLKTREELKYYAKCKEGIVLIESSNPIEEITICYLVTNSGELLPTSPLQVDIENVYEIAPEF